MVRTGRIGSFLTSTGNTEYQFLGHEDNSLRRITYFGQEQSEYDVVLVIMESLNWTDIRYLGGDPMLMPALNCLAEQDVRMDRCF